MNQAFLQKVNEIIDENIGNSSFGAKDLSNFMGMSHSSLWRKVRSQTGKSITQYIREVRLRKALEILQQEDVTVSELTFRLGFSSPSYFTACFKEFYGQPPVEIKKSNGNKFENGNNGDLPGRSGSDKENKQSGLIKLIFKNKLIQTAVISVLLIGIAVTAIIVAPKLFRSQDEMDKSIAVLPFKLLSDKNDKQYLADGMMYAIVNHLLRLKELRVAPILSVEQYRNTQKTAGEIGREMDVGYILFGSFQMQDGRVNLSLQLIDTGDESLKWNKELNRNWTDVFNVQSEVASQIANELKVFVSPQEKEMIEADPTTDLTAYDYYLLGNQFYYRSYDVGDRRYTNAIRKFEEAIEIDSAFALAWIGLARCSRDLFWYGYDRSEQNLAITEQYLKKALGIAPKLKEVRFEEAVYYYQCKKDYKKSINLLEQLKSDYPLDADIHAWAGYVYRRMGEFNKGMENIENAISLNPSYWQYWIALGLLLDHYFSPKFKDAEKYYLQAIELNPSYSKLYSWLLNHYLMQSNLSQANKFLRENEENFDPYHAILYSALVEFYSRNYNEAIKIAKSLPEGIILNFEHMLNFSKHHYLAIFYSSINDQIMAKRHFELEKDFQESLLDGSVNDFNSYGALAYAYAGLGMEDKAMDAIRKYQEIFYDNFSNPSYAGHYPVFQKCKVLVMTGDYEKALEKLDSLIKQHCNSYYGYLKLDPFWDPLRDSAEFKEILSKAEHQLNLSGE